MKCNGLILIQGKSCWLYRNYKFEYVTLDREWSNFGNFIRCVNYILNSRNLDCEKSERGEATILINFALFVY